MDKEFSRNLSRNKRHVHHSYLFHCDHCGYDDDIFVGTGMLFPVVYDELVEKIITGFYGEKWQSLFMSNTNTIVDGTLTLYVCSSCGHYLSDYNLGLYALKDGLSESEKKLAGQDHPDDEMQFVYLYGITWPKQYYRKIGDYVHRCPSCQKRMHIGGYNDKPVCPKCGENGTIGIGRVIWD